MHQTIKKQYKDIARDLQLDRKLLFQFAERLSEIAAHRCHLLARQKKESYWKVIRLIFINKLSIYKWHNNEYIYL